MSILLTDPWSIPPAQAAEADTPLHQSSSGTPPTTRPRRWWNWFGRRDQRTALRELADNPHLLNDLGLSREQALHGAAKPFWR